MRLMDRSLTLTRGPLFFLRTLVVPSIAVAVRTVAAATTAPAFCSSTVSDTRTVTTATTTNQGRTTNMSLSASSSRQWHDLRQSAMEKAILPLSDKSHKGSSGRVAILGGSALYTGAPFYAAMASLQAGADLAYVLTAEEASLPIKCYSPELMVAPVYSASEFDRVTNVNDEGKNESAEQEEELVNKMVEKVMDQIGRAHCLVIGPGLGRSEMVFRAVAKVIQEARKLGLHMVLDADALFMLTLPRFRAVLEGYEKAILTPNVVEYKRLFPTESNNSASNNASSFAHLQGVTIVQKGQADQILQVGSEITTRYACGEMGGLKRSGGIGDVLAGTLGTLVSWKAILEQQQEKAPESSWTGVDLQLSCWTACCFVKRATARAYQEKKRAMTAPDVLDQLGPAIDEMTS